MKTYEVRFRQLLQQGAAGEPGRQNPAARTRRIEQNEPKTYIDVTTPEVREMQKLNRKVDLVGQAITAAVIALGALVLIYNLARWLCGF